MAKKGRRSNATAKDAELILKLYNLRREATIRKARDFLTTQFWPQSYDDFKSVVASFGSEQNAWFRQVWTYWDMACAMVLTGVIDEELFFKTCGEPYFLYAKWKPFIEQTRKDFDNPDFMIHVEAVANKTPRAKERVKRLEARIKMRTQMAAAKAS